ncbi:MAG: DMT family transporter [Deltaproteobacteria bacterium]|nr:MAG: DMT family transporter [Deltaproteobacteria bacterium]
MGSWYTLAIISLFLMGMQRFLYKVSAEKRCNTAWTTFSFMATVAILSSILFLFLEETVTNLPFLCFIALVNSAAFLLATVTHMEALKNIPASVAYPIIRLSAVLVVIFSILFFKDRPSIYQVIGIVLAMVVIVVLTMDFGDDATSYGRRKRGFLCIFVALIAGAAAIISSKFAAMYTNKMAFIAISYLASTFFALGLRKRLQTEEANENPKDALLIGLVMGVINFAGYYSYLKALSTGPLSIITSLTGMHFIIAIILSALIYKEKLTPSRILGISLTVVSIILLKL